MGYRTGERGRHFAPTTIKLATNKINHRGHRKLTHCEDSVVQWEAYWAAALPAAYADVLKSKRAQAG
jgi:hypothetical protein